MNERDQKSITVWNSSHRSFSLRTFGPTNKCVCVRNDSVLAGVYFVHCCCPPDEMKDRVDNSIANNPFYNTSIEN